MQQNRNKLVEPLLEIDTEAPVPHEPFLTVKDAAAALGIHGWKLARAVRNGTVPSYTFLNRRRLVRLSEVIAVIEVSRTGGHHV